MLVYTECFHWSNLLLKVGLAMAPQRPPTFRPRPSLLARSTFAILLVSLCLPTSSLAALPHPDRNTVSC